MTYLEKLKTEAESKALPALAEKMRKLEKQRAAVEDRIKNERENLALAEATLADFKGRAAEQLAKSTSAYAEFQGRLRRLKLEAETAKEALALLDAETRPAVEKELRETREKLLQALRTLCLAARPSCEARMAELLNSVVAEHDGFLDACVRLHEDHGCAFTPPPRYEGPRVEHARLDHIGKHRLTSPAPFLAFTPPPAPAEAMPPTTPDTGAAPVDENDRRNAPESTISAPSDAGAVPERAPNAVQSVQDPEEAALDASGAAISDGADPLPYPAESSEKKATFLTGEPAPDAPPDAAAPQLTIHDNIMLGQGWCSICDGITDHWWGPELFTASTLEKVCHECGERLNPALMVTLKEMHRRFDEDHPPQFDPADSPF